MIISILTIFPQMIREILNYGPVGRGVKTKILEINPVDLRDFTLDKHRSVDDKPFGGGPGMVMRVDIIDRALQKVVGPQSMLPSSRGLHPRSRSAQLRGSGVPTDFSSKNPGSSEKAQKIVLLSPQGKLFSQQAAQEYSKLDHLILISGRYEGIDERVKGHLVDEELSIGNYVLSGGEIPAMAVADAVARLIPGVLGNEESLISESFSSISLSPQPLALSPIFDFPHYTQPAEYRGWKVPQVLRSGNHAEIQKWREERSKARNRVDNPEFPGLLHIS